VPVDVEVLGEPALEPTRIELLCRAACASRGVQDGHLAVEFVDEAAIAQLNAEHRGKEGPTDVLSFPVDGTDELGGAPRELGDIVICPPRTEDLAEAVVHGTLHLLGMDHERDNGEMLELQDDLMRRLR